MKLFSLIPVCILSLSSLDTIAAPNKTLWEVGAGVVGVNLPLYPGSSDNESLLIPFPFIRLQSKYLEVDEGIRGYFFESPNLRLNISGDLGVPVNNEDSKIRNGLPDLNTVFQIGPSLEVIFSGGRRQPSEFRFELPVRTAIATDLEHTENIGWILEPRISYETLRPRKEGFAYQISAGLRYASKEYHQYYYDVPAAFATIERPVYESDAGYSGLFTDLVGNWRDKDLIYFAFIRYQNLSSTAFEDSPLVEQESYFSFGFGLAWIIAGSKP